MSPVIRPSASPAAVISTTMISGGIRATVARAGGGKRRERAGQSVAMTFAGNNYAVISRGITGQSGDFLFEKVTQD